MSSQQNVASMRSVFCAMYSTQKWVMKDRRAELKKANFNIRVTDWNIVGNDDDCMDDDDDCMEDDDDCMELKLYASQ